MLHKSPSALLIGSLFALSLSLSVPAHAQKPAVVPAKKVDPNEALSKTVSLQIENGSLAEAFKLVLKQIDYPYSLVLPNNQDKITVNTNGKAGVVLGMLLRASSLPLDYRVAEDTIMISKKQAEPAEPLPAPVAEPEFFRGSPKIKRLTYISAKDVVGDIKKFPAYQEMKLIPTDSDDTVLITVNNEREERILADVERTIDLFDSQPVPLIMKAELIIEINGDTRKRTQTAFTTTGTTFYGKEITLDINLQGDTTDSVPKVKAKSAEGMKIGQGLCRFTVTPVKSEGEATIRIPGSEPKDNLFYEMIILKTEGTMQLEITPDGYAKPLKFSRKFNGVDRVALKDVTMLLTSAVKLETEKNPLDANIRLVLTVARKPEVWEKKKANK